MTTPEQNAATVRELIQRVMNEGDIGFAEKTLSESYVERSPMPGGTADKAGAIAMFNMMRTQTPDMHIDVDDVIATGNKVAVRSTMTGTDTEGFMPGMAATGKPFSTGDRRLHLRRRRHEHGALRRLRHHGHDVAARPAPGSTCVRPAGWRLIPAPARTRAPSPGERVG